MYFIKTTLGAGAEQNQRKDKLVIRLLHNLEDDSIIYKREDNKLGYVPKNRE